MTRYLPAALAVLLITAGAMLACGQPETSTRAIEPARVTVHAVVAVPVHRTEKEN